jgi:hypothetical protein
MNLYAASQKVAGLILDEDDRFLNLHNPSSPTVALVLTQPLTGTSALHWQTRRQLRADCPENAGA